MSAKDIGGGQRPQINLTTRFELLQAEFAMYVLRSAYQ